MVHFLVYGRYRLMSFVIKRINCVKGGPLRGHFTAPLLIALRVVNSAGWQNKSSPTVCGRSSNHFCLPALHNRVVVDPGAMIERF